MLNEPAPDQAPSAGSQQPQPQPQPQPGAGDDQPRGVMTINVTTQEKEAIERVTDFYIDRCMYTKIAHINRCMDKRHLEILGNSRSLAFSSEEASSIKYKNLVSLNELRKVELPP